MAALLAAVGTAYHIDPRGGNDHATGTSPSKAWRSFLPLSRTHLRPGDRLVIAGGTTIYGPLELNGLSGVVVSSYGKGRATIDGGSGSGILVQGGSDLSIHDLALTASGRKANDGNGLVLKGVRNVRLERIDVSRYRLTGVEVVGCSGAVLEHIVSHDNGGAGIAVSPAERGMPRSVNVTIRDCKALNNPGDPKNLTNHSGNGIVVGGVDGCLIEYCEAAGNGWDMPRKGNGPVGIWAWNASRVTIQHCVSHENKSPGDDGGGFDLDGGVTNSVLQNNLSFGNEGTGYLLCQYPGGGLWKDNVVRHNISYEDGKKSFGSGIALYTPQGMNNMSDALIEHNTIVNSRFAVSTWGDLPGIVYQNNVFVSGHETLNLAGGEGGYRNSAFRGNVAWSAATPHPALIGASHFASTAAWEETGGLSVDPRLRMPGSLVEIPTDPRKLKELGWFRPIDGSPCVVQGKLVYGAQM